MFLSINSDPKIIATTENTKDNIKTILYNSDPKNNRFYSVKHELFEKLKPKKITLGTNKKSSKEIERNEK